MNVKELMHNWTQGNYGKHVDEKENVKNLWTNMGAPMGMESLDFVTVMVLSVYDCEEIRGKAMSYKYYEAWRWNWEFLQGL